MYTTGNIPAFIAMLAAKYLETLALHLATKARLRDDVISLRLELVSSENLGPGGWKHWNTQM